MPVLGGRLFLLPDQLARERGHMWEDSVMTDTSAITCKDIGNSESSLCQMAVVNGGEFAVRELPITEEGVHEELIVHSLEVQVWGDSVCREQSA